MKFFTQSHSMLANNAKSQPEQPAATSSLPLYRQVQHRLLGLCILLAPLTLTVYLVSWINVQSWVNVHGTPLTYSRSIAAIGTLANQIHMTFGILAAIFLPLGFFGMALLGMKRSPWLATIAAIFALVGWAPFAAIVSIDILAYDVARAGSNPQLVTLWTQFNGDPTITLCQDIYIIGHMLSAVLLGILLGRTQRIPNWAALAFVLSSPVTMFVFMFHLPPQIFIWVVCALFLIGALPASLAMWNGKSDT